MKPNDELLARLAGRFSALADMNRLRLLLRLQDGEARVMDLATDLALLQPNVSRHLKVLVTAGLVRSERRDGVVWYAIRDPTLGQLCDLVCSAVRTQADIDHRNLHRVR